MILFESCRSGATIFPAISIEIGRFQFFMIFWKISENVISPNFAPNFLVTYGKEVFQISTDCSPSYPQLKPLLGLAALLLVIEKMGREKNLFFNFWKFQFSNGPILSPIWDGDLKKILADT